MTYTDMIKNLMIARRHGSLREWKKEDADLITDVIKELMFLRDNQSKTKSVSEFMNPPEQDSNITIDLTSGTQTDYKDECNRLSAILESLTRQNDEYEFTLQKVQWENRELKMKLNAVHAILDID